MSGVSARSRWAAIELVAHHEAQVVVLEQLDLPDLVRGAEAVEEVQEGDAGLERRRVGDEGEVVGLLDGAGGRACAKPIWRQAITSEWSPKIERAWVATVRAATCIVKGVSSPAILYMLGIIRRRPCDAVKVVVSAPACSAPCTAPGRAALGLHLDHVGDDAPDVLAALRRPLVGRTRPCSTRG